MHSWIFFYSASGIKQQSMDRHAMLHSDTLSWFRAKQFLFLLLNAGCLVEKRQIPILLSMVWPALGSNPMIYRTLGKHDLTSWPARDSNPWSIALGANILTITPPMQSSNWWSTTNQSSDKPQISSCRNNNDRSRWLSRTWLMGQSQKFVVGVFG